jgi:hypothetical protein
MAEGIADEGAVPVPMETNLMQKVIEGGGNGLSSKTCGGGLFVGMKAILSALFIMSSALLLAGCLGSKYPPKVENAISWNKEGFGEQDYFKDLVEAEKHGADVAGEPNYPPRPILPEYIAPRVIINNIPSGKSEEKSKGEKERDAHESFERSRISRERDQMGEDYNRQVALAIQVVEDRRTRAIESFLGSRGWIKTVKIVETSFYESGQRESVKNYKDGKLMFAVSWKPDGEKCPETNVVDGNGVVVSYDKEGMEHHRRSFKDGIEVYE